MMRLSFFTSVAALAVLLAASGCSLSLFGLGGDGEEPDVESDDQDCPLNQNGACIVGTAACSPDDLSRSNDGTACATCESPDGAVEICGQRTTARCSQLENANGEPCQRCALADDVLYDDCQLATGPGSGGYCEQIEEGQLPATDAFDAGASIVVEDEQDCEVCYDAFGTVVSTVCRPQADTCENVWIDGKECERCTFEGELAYLECAPLDLDPEVCEVYEDEDGRCVDCYADGALISHACVLGDPEARLQSYCESYQTVDGLLCTECNDAEGNLVEFFCDDPPALAFCEELVFEQTGQICTLCVDEFGAIASSECFDVSCLDAFANDLDVNVEEECVSANLCTIVNGEGGELCRECPLLDANGQPTGQIERQCLNGGGGELFCEEVTEFLDAPITGPDDPNGAPVVEEITCLRCTDMAGNLVYEECDGGAAPAPPTCSYETQVDGTQCLVCTDEQTGELVYDCGPIEPDCWEQEIEGELCWVCGADQGTAEVVECYGSLPVCSDVVGLPLVDADELSGLMFIDPSTGQEAEAMVDCRTCDDATTAADPDVAACLLLLSCAQDGTDPGNGNGNGNANPPGGIATGPCTESALWTMSIPQCGAAWNNSQGGDEGYEEVMRVMSWLLQSYAVVPLAAGIIAEGDGDLCEACGCSRGDRLEVWVVPGDETSATMMMLGFTESTLVEPLPAP